MQSLKFEHKLYASVKEKMEEMQQHNMSWIEASYIDYYSCMYICYVTYLFFLCFENGVKMPELCVFQHLGNMICLIFLMHILMVLQTLSLQNGLGHILQILSL